MHLPWSDGFQVKSTWNENVNLIVVRKAITPNSQYDYEVTTIECSDVPFLTENSEIIKGQRPNIRRHLPSTNLHQVDFSAEWRRILDDQLMERYETNSSSDIPLFSDQCITWKQVRQSTTSANILKPQLALRICALRCLFQELGILLCSTTAPLTVDSLLEWQTSVNYDPFNFLKLFQRESHLRPQVESLFEWWNWMTPTNVGRSPRYDTLVYLCVIDPWPSSTGSMIRPENIIRWNHLEEFFESYSSKSFLISPIQLYELVRLSSHPWTQWLRQFAEQREQNGIQRWVPMISLYKNGTISYLPGDQFYPPTVNLVALKTPRMYESLTLDRMRQKTTSGRLNRIEHNGYWCRIVVTDAIDTAGGHSRILYDRSPVTRIANTDTEKSELTQINAKL